MLNINSLRTDKAKVNNGVWVEDDHGARFLIARWANENMREFVRPILEERKRVLGLREVNDENMKLWQKELDAAEVKAMAQTILLGWEGIVDDDGQPVPYSHEQAYAWLSDPELEDLTLWIKTQSQDVDNYRKEQLADQSKN